MYTIDKDKRLIPLFRQINDIYEPYNECRQKLPATYLHNGCVDIIKTDTITLHNSSSGNNIYPYVMSEKYDVDIDTYHDWEIAEHKFSF